MNADARSYILSNPFSVHTKLELFFFFNLTVLICFPAHYATAMNNCKYITITLYKISQIKAASNTVTKVF